MVTSLQAQHVLQTSARNSYAAREACGIGNGILGSKRLSSAHTIPAGFSIKIPVVEFHHMGTYKLKGVTGEQVVMQINSHTFAERVFPKKAASSKAELISPGKGLIDLIYSVALSSQR